MRTKGDCVNLFQCSKSSWSVIQLASTANCRSREIRKKFLAALDGVEAITVQFTDPGSRPRFCTRE